MSDNPVWQGIIDAAADPEPDPAPAELHIVTSKMLDMILADVARLRWLAAFIRTRPQAATLYAPDEMLKRIAAEIDKLLEHYPE